MNLETVISENVWAEIRQNYEDGRYTSAILDAVHYLGMIIREKGNLEGDGAQLIGDAFGGAKPRIRITKLKSENDKNVQRGTESLLRGLYQAIRNPRSHEKISDTKEDANAIIIFIDYLIRLIGSAKSQFSISDFLPRVFDASFVATDKYAKLLLREVPRNKRMDVMSEVLQKKDSADCKKIKFFFSALLKSLDAGQKSQVFDSISEELQSVDTNIGIIKIVQLLEMKEWLKIETASRIRIENKFIESIQEGSYNATANKCSAGMLGTWATSLFPVFSLKREAYNAIIDRLLNGTKAAEDYALRFVAEGLPYLAEKPTQYLQAKIREKLKAGHKGFYDLVQQFTFENEWETPFAADVAGFVSQPDDDEVPF